MGEKSPVNVTANVNVMFHLPVKPLMDTLFSLRLAIVILPKDDTERILKLIGAQNAGPGEDNDDEDIEHESDQ